jgi:hypothetical protein
VHIALRRGGAKEVVVVPPAAMPQVTTGQRLPSCVWHAERLDGHSMHNVGPAPPNPYTHTHLGHVEEHGPLAQSVAFSKSSVAARHARACSCRQQAAGRRRYQVRSTEVSLGQGRRYLGLRHAYTNHTCCLAARKSCPSPWAPAAANAHLSLPAGSLPPRQCLGSIPAGRATDTSAPTFASTDAPACQQAATARSQHHAPSSHSHRWCSPSQPHPSPPCPPWRSHRAAGARGG